MIERAGFWRRAVAAVIDIVTAQALLLLAVAALFGATGGRVTTGISFYTVCRPAVAPPANWAPPVDFAMTGASLCTSSLFGLTTGSFYVARHEGKPGEPATSLSVAASPDGSTAMRVLSLDALCWPLFVLLRWLADRSAGGSLGRRLMRIAVTDWSGTATGSALRTLLARRYGRFAWPYGPGAVMVALCALWAFVVGSTPQAATMLTWLASNALIGAGHLAALLAILRRQDTFYDGPSGAVVAPRHAIADATEAQPGPIVAAVPTPLADLAASAWRAWAAMPWLSLALSGVLACIYVGELLLPWSPAGPSSISPDTMMAWGGMNRHLVVGSHQLYRLLAAIFLHANLIHLLLNAAALIVAGFLLERLLGRALFLGVFLVGGLAGSVTSVTFNPLQQISIGASGAVLALFAAMVGVAFALPPGDARRWRLAWAFTICLPALLPLTPLADGLTVDRADHAGGELAGLLLGTAVAAAWRRGRRYPPPHRALAAGLGFAALAAASVLVGGLRAPVQSSAMIPPALLPKDEDAGMRDATTLAERYPEDPRALLFLAQADVLDGHPGDAERDLDRALAAADRLDPEGTHRNAYAGHVLLGGRFSEIGDRAAAIVQYTSALADRTDDMVAFRQRGIAEFYAGRDEAALTDLDAATRLTPVDPYAALWDDIVAARAWRSDRNGMLRAALEPGRWPAPVLRFFLGEIDADALGVAAADVDPRLALEHRCEADFYRGERLALSGDAAGAEPMMRSAVAECPRNFIEHAAAVSELAGRGPRPAR